MLDFVNLFKNIDYSDLSDEDKRTLFSSIIKLGSYHNFEELSNHIMVDFSIFNSLDFKYSIPVNIDCALLELILKTGKLDTEYKFLYNVANISPYQDVKNYISDFFSENYPDLYFDKMEFYQFH